MNGREQPYINGNGTGYYHKTPWVDDVPDRKSTRLNSSHE